jgi:hypothetical protein
MVPHNGPPANPKPSIREWLGITTAAVTCMRLLLELVRLLR